mgnify:CR=1 FL=1
MYEVVHNFELELPQVTVATLRLTNTWWALTDYSFSRSTTTYSIPISYAARIYKVGVQTVSVGLASIFNIIKESTIIPHKVLITRCANFFANTATSRVVTSEPVLCVVDGTILWKRILYHCAPWRGWQYYMLREIISRNFHTDTRHLTPSRSSLCREKFSKIWQIWFPRSHFPILTDTYGTCKP